MIDFKMPENTSPQFKCVGCGLMFQFTGSSGKCPSCGYLCTESSCQQVDASDEGY